MGNRPIRAESMVGSPWLKHTARTTCSPEGHRAHSRTGQNPYERNQRRVPSSEPHPLRTRGISPSSQSTRQQPYRAESMVGSARSKHRPAPRVRPRGTHRAHSRAGHNLYERNQLWVVTRHALCVLRGGPHQAHGRLGSIPFERNHGRLHSVEALARARARPRNSTTELTVGRAKTRTSGINRGYHQSSHTHTLRAFRGGPHRAHSRSFERNQWWGPLDRSIGPRHALAQGTAPQSSQSDRS